MLDGFDSFLPQTNNWAFLDWRVFVLYVVLHKQEDLVNYNTHGTTGGPGGRDRTLAVKSRKTAEKITFFS